MQQIPKRWNRQIPSLTTHLRQKWSQIGPASGKPNLVHSVAQTCARAKSQLQNHPCRSDSLKN
jgi:hypothetical protein